MKKFFSNGIAGAAIALSILAGGGCSTARMIRSDPFFSSFLEKTSLLMTEEEIDLFLHMPDTAAKVEFIEDFWKIRDPDSMTPENENRMEFERRVRFANEWFGAMNPRRATPAPAELHKDRGWNTDKGAAYIVLGPPEFIGDATEGVPRQRVEFDDGYHLSVADIWYYERFKASIYFYFPGVVSARETDDLEMSMRSPQIGIRDMSSSYEVMERAKAEWITRDHLKGWGEPLRFQAAYRDGALRIGIPLKTVHFRVNDDKTLTAAYSVEVRIYRDSRKIETIASNKAFVLKEEEAEELPAIEIIVPYVPQKKGEYLFDVIVKADDPTVLSRRRQYVRMKL